MYFLTPRRNMVIFYELKIKHSSTILTITIANSLSSISSMLHPTHALTTSRTIFVNGCTIITQTHPTLPTQRIIPLLQREQGSSMPTLHTDEIHKRRGTK